MSTPSPSDVALVRKGGPSRTGMYAVGAVVIVVLLIVVVGWQVGWFKASSPPSNGLPGCTLPPSVTVAGAGSTFVAPLMTTWQSTYSHSQIQYGSVGSGTGITDLTLKTVDFGASDAPLSPAQQAALPGKVVTIPESAGGVAIIYNLPGLGAKLNFTGPILAEIYLGTITTWNDPTIQAANPNVALPSNSIVVVHRSEGSGTTFAFTSYLSAESSTWATTAKLGRSTLPTWPTGVGQKASGGVSSFVQSTPYTIGYVDMSYALTNSLQYGAVRNPSNVNIVPTVSNTQSAMTDAGTTLPRGDDLPGWYNVSLLNAQGVSDYPITTFTYLLVYESLDVIYGSSMTLDHAKNLVDFLNWTITYGQAYSAALYYVPLAANVVTSDQASLALVQYSGASVPVCTQA